MQLQQLAKFILLGSFSVAARQIHCVPSGPATLVEVVDHHQGKSRNEVAVRVGCLNHLNGHDVAIRNKYFSTDNSTGLG